MSDDNSYDETVLAVRGTIQLLKSESADFDASN